MISEIEHKNVNFVEGCDLLSVEKPLPQRLLSLFLNVMHKSAHSHTPDEFFVKPFKVIVLGLLSYMPPTRRMNSAVKG